METSLAVGERLVSVEDDHLIEVHVHQPGLLGKRAVLVDAKVVARLVVPLLPSRVASTPFHVHTHTHTTISGVYWYTNMPRGGVPSLSPTDEMNGRLYHICAKPAACRCILTRFFFFFHSRRSLD